MTSESDDEADSAADAKIARILSDIPDDCESTTDSTSFKEMPFSESGPVGSKFFEPADCNVGNTVVPVKNPAQKNNPPSVIKTMTPSIATTLFIIFYPLTFKKTLRMLFSAYCEDIYKRLPVVLKGENV
jgi:hypothetical protein